MTQSEPRGRYCWYCNNSKTTPKCIACGYHVDCIVNIDGTEKSPHNCEYCDSLFCGHCIGNERDGTFTCQSCIDNTDSPRVKCRPLVPKI